MMPNLPVVRVVDDDAAVHHAIEFCLEVDGLEVPVHGSAARLLKAMRSALADRPSS